MRQTTTEGHSSEQYDSAAKNQPVETQNKEPNLFVKTPSPDQQKSPNVKTPSPGTERTVKNKNRTVNEATGQKNQLQNPPNDKPSKLSEEKATDDKPTSVYGEKPTGSKPSLSNEKASGLPSPNQKPTSPEVQRKSRKTTRSVNQEAELPQQPKATKDKRWFSPSVADHHPAVSPGPDRKDKPRVPKSVMASVDAQSKSPDVPNKNLEGLSPHDQTAISPEVKKKKKKTRSIGNPESKVGSNESDDGKAMFMTSKKKRVKPKTQSQSPNPAGGSKESADEKVNTRRRLLLPSYDDQPISPLDRREKRQRGRIIKSAEMKKQEEARRKEAAKQPEVKQQQKKTRSHNQSEDMVASGRFSKESPKLKVQPTPPSNKGAPISPGIPATLISGPATPKTDETNKNVAEAGKDKTDVGDDLDEKTASSSVASSMMTSVSGAVSPASSTTRASSMSRNGTTSPSGLTDSNISHTSANQSISTGPDGNPLDPAMAAYFDPANANKANDNDEIDLDKQINEDITHTKPARRSSQDNATLAKKALERLKMQKKRNDEAKKIRLKKQRMARRKKRLLLKMEKKQSTNSSSSKKDDTDSSMKVSRKKKSKKTKTKTSKE
ncbi:unnamed protein product [Bursaphelenchus okinawaensis]|uniref:Uncharacterized protein n=1 Tax=Bursaphelenchus okinawaensis TaxID=465554 RepID=A0A811LQD3_9BILA|nr:unnamed protein product [Bursaphelenchus okinawaensis]CAG9127075.1 unnamed protein product [Bursaphelenchus okinawaensis]